MSLPPAPRVFAIANQKGGVGKTTTAINLATALAAVGETVLLVDMDPQGNASTGLGIERARRHLTVSDVLAGEASLAEATIPTAVPRLAIVAASPDLIGIDLELASAPDRATRLRRAVARLAVETPPTVPDAGAADPAAAAAGRVTTVIVDCPPSLTLLTVNALAAAHAVIAPLQCEFFALEGLSQLMRTIEQVKTALNPELVVHGVVMTMYDARNNLANQVIEDVRQVMPDLVYETVIPRNVRLSEAPSHGKPALLYDIRCSGSQAYLKLASEVIRRERRLAAAAGRATPG